MKDQKVLQVIKEQIEIVESMLVQLRSEFEWMDNNHPYGQAIKAQEIAIAVAKLETLKHLYKICGGQ